MTHHMPTPHAPSDLHLPPSYSLLTPFIHASLKYTYTQILQVFLCSFSLTTPVSQNIFFMFRYMRVNPSIQGQKFTTEAASVGCVMQTLTGADRRR